MTVTNDVGPAPVLSDEIPRASGSLPVCSGAELVYHLTYRPLAGDFWIPIPGRDVLAQFLVETQTRLDLRPTLNESFGPEHHMAGLLHGIRLREFIIDELDDMSQASKWRHVLGLDRVNWFVRCQVVMELLFRDIRDLENQRIFHSFDVEREDYCSFLIEEVNRNWDLACWRARRRAEEARRRATDAARCVTWDSIALP